MESQPQETATSYIGDLFEPGAACNPITACMHATPKHKLNLYCLKPDRTPPNTGSRGAPDEPISLMFLLLSTG